jgi:hypothetical protein
MQKLIECGRCERRFEESVNLPREYEDSPLPYIPLDTLSSDEPLDEAISRVTKKVKEREERVKPVLTEVLAIYCAQDDTIYYNVDRIHAWIDSLTKRVVNAILYWFGECGGRRYFLAFKTVGKTVGELERVVEKCVTRVALNCLVARERHHWASKSSDEEKATANGFYDALKIRMLKRILE